MADDRIKLLKSLSDETRFNIIKGLLKGEKTVSQIVKEVKKAQPTISLHLKLLHLNNIITSRKEGKFIFYKIKNKEVKKVIDILK
ncbi:winged helix-turn-helix transcriptional regulator [Candidatus Woesearchaeota archaeon]|nr:winged helix-turn-helix transcriptional regulator [Candidatus Woesearchaeota archaeon]